MGHYWKRCPYCGHTIETGHGFPTKQLGNPTKRCLICRQVYKDSCIIEWESASIFRKISYFFANGRFLLCFLPSLLSICFMQIGTVLADWLIYVIGFAIFSVSVAMCALYVRWKVRDYLGIRDYFGVDDDYDDDARKLKTKYITLEDTTFGRLNQTNKK